MRISVFSRAAGFPHGSQRREHDDQAALHVGDAGAGGDVAAGVGDDGVFLEAAGGFKDGVHVADQEQTLAAFVGALRAGVLRDQVAGAAGQRLHGNPLDLEAERFEFWNEKVFDGFDAGQMHGAAVDVDDLLEQRLILPVVGVDGRNHLPFQRCERGRTPGRLSQEDGND
jgi:hypothetical protein